MTKGAEGVYRIASDGFSLAVLIKFLLDEAPLPLLDVGDRTGLFNQGCQVATEV